MVTGMRPRLLVALAAVVALGGCGGGGDGGASPTTTTTGPAATTAPTVATTVASTTTLAAPRIVDVVLADSSDDPPHTYELHYPRLEGVSEPIANAVNNRVQAWAEDIVADFTRNVTTSGTTGAGGLSTLTAEYEVTLLDPTVVSFISEGSTYHAGAAHPFSTAKAFTFDLTSGEELEIDDAFLDDSGYLDRLVELSRAELADQFGDDVTVFDDSLVPLPETFRGWHLGPTDLAVTFEQYQIGPGAAGQPTVVIPYSDLVDHIDPDGPIGGRA